jgi:hypothetical protein
MFQPTTTVPVQRGSKGKDFHVGYSPVLLRTELKEKLRRFRHEKGFHHESHIERCLLSAAVEMLLSESSLHPRWMEMLAEATSRDVMLVSQG